MRFEFQNIYLNMISKFLERKITKGQTRYCVKRSFCVSLKIV